ncbi:protein TolQ [Guyparkeria sp. SCN-R1]|uniref:protein TolQ n=1 Tax=Guyparkeria sp. SCN-R1 TaxID=2341113 RepID=UPI000F64ADD1|nr:protein TolQ [Guyparkeria sp. SCN-R1]RRQ20204.1 protein TolQ [Guyparkeria sp. SCN-R1]
MNADPSVVELITGASLPVLLVLIILALASVGSWALIFHKARTYKRAVSGVRSFESSFWAGGSLNEFYDRISREARPREGHEAIFEAGFREFQRLRQAEDRGHTQIIDGVERAMRVAENRQIDQLEEGVPFLATVGSVSPYVGLFGTVWGIMSAFMNLGTMQSATLAAVAPPIAEALIATAMGLFAAIPAVIAYNRYTQRIDWLAGRYENFVDEFLGLLQRQLGGK